MQQITTNTQTVTQTPIGQNITTGQIIQQHDNKPRNSTDKSATNNCR